MWLVLACAQDASPAAVARDPSLGSPTGEDSGAAADGDSPPDSAPPDSAPPGDSGDSGGDTSPPEPVVRFVALGDAGEGNEDQYAVAGVMATVCAAQGCDFALYLGDNFYDDGVDGVDDPQFQSKFELPYAALSFPFYVVMGNHDYGGDGAGYEFDKYVYEVEYSSYSEKWTMPSPYYRVDKGEVSLWGLDTNTIFWGFGADQLSWLQGELAASGARWKIAFGHHPYRSNGQHGNAGEYEGFEWLPIANGAAVEDFVEAGLCDQVDVYICGHDHLREWLEPQCGMELIVSGAGAKTTDHVDRGNPTWFESDVEGFAWIEIQGGTMRVQFWDKEGTMDYEQSVTR